MTVYQLNLDALEEAVKEYGASAARVGRNIDTSHGVISKTNETIFSGADGDTFRQDFTGYVDNNMRQLQETLLGLESVLEQGLEEAKGCKKICNDFDLSLGGAGNGKSEADMHGMFYCDQSVISGLKAVCSEAVSLTTPIRENAEKIEKELSKLRMVKLDAWPYTSRLKAGCDKVERLEDHSGELSTYAETAELIDDSFKNALDRFAAPFAFDISLGVYIADISAQAERIMKIMDHEDLSDYDRLVLDTNLRTMMERGDVEGLQKLAEHAAGREDGVWTTGDAYVMAQVLKCAEADGNAKLASAVYNGMKKVTSTKEIKEGRPPYTACTYEFGLDENKVAAISAELDPDKDGLTYYSLQRRAKFHETKTIHVNGTNGEIPEMDLEIHFTCDESGRLVSVFTADGEKTRLASVDMNEVLGDEDKRKLETLGYTKEERVAFMSSIYTDEDILFIGELVRAETEEDYREIFQNDPKLLGTAMKMGLYNHSIVLMNKGAKYDDKMRTTSDKQEFEELENFLNGMLYRKTDKVMQDEADGAGNGKNWNTDFRQDYLDAMITHGEVWMDIYRGELKKNSTNKNFVNNNLEGFAKHTQMISLYATLSTRMSEDPRYLSGCYMQIHDLGLYEDFYQRESNVDRNSVLFSYCENMMYDDKANVQLQQGKEIPITANIEIFKRTGDEILRSSKCNDRVEKAREARRAVPDAIIGSLISIGVPGEGDIGNIMNGTAVAGNIYSVIETYRELEELDKEIDCVLGGAEIAYQERKDQSYIKGSTVLKGEYDANTMLKYNMLKKEGLGKFFVENELLTEEGLKKIGDDIKSNADTKYTGIFNIKEKENEQNLYEQYLILTGEDQISKDKGQYPVQKFTDTSPDHVLELIDQLEQSYGKGFDYVDYNMIEEYYMVEEVNE